MQSILQAIASNNLELVKYEVSRSKPYRYMCPEPFYREAIKVGSMEMVRYLYSEGFYPAALLISTAIEANQSEIATWMLDKLGKSCDTFVNAAFGASLDTIKWLHAQGCPWDSRLSDYAARTRPLTLKWLIENGCPIDDDIWSQASFFNNRETMKILHATGNPIMLAEAHKMKNIKRCPFCRNEKFERRKATWLEWEMEFEAYNSYIQWLPKETMKDVIILI